MNALGSWLKEIILMVLLAIFADLLLPVKSMQKYVRVVMALAVIATMLQPVTPFLNQGWADRISQWASAEVFGGQDSVNGNAPLMSTSVLSALQQDRLEEARQLLSDSLKNGIVSEIGVQVHAVEVDGLDNSGKHIHVLVQLSPLAKDTAPAVQQWVAHQLNVPLSQVRVETVKGGD